MIQIAGLATAVPSLKLTQKKALDFILKNFRMRKGTEALYRKVFANESVRTRRFSMSKLEEVLEEDPDKINRRFEKEAVKLSMLSLSKALARARVRPQELDFLAVATCTGYLCPGISSRMIDALGLRKDIRTLDVVGMGCGSAIPVLEQANNFLRAHPNAVAACLATEICSAAMVSDDSADLVISNALFADGSAAVVLQNSANPGRPSLRSFASLNFPEWRETLKFTTQNGRLRNVLKKEVPMHAGKALHELAAALLAKENLKRTDIDAWIFHLGGEKVLQSIQSALQLRDRDMALSRKSLKEHGNLSSPSVLYVLENLLGKGGSRGGKKAFLAAFGAGFSAHACLLDY